MSNRKNIKKNIKNTKFRSVKNTITAVNDISFTSIFEHQIFNQPLPELSKSIFSDFTINTLSSSTSTVTSGSTNYSYIKKCIGIKLAYIEGSSPLAYKVDTSNSNNNKIGASFINLRKIISEFKNYTFEVFSKPGTRITNHLSFVVESGYLLILDESIPGDSISIVKRVGDLANINTLFLNCFIYEGKFGFENTSFHGSEGIVLPEGNSTSGIEGTIRYNNGKYEGYTSRWQNLEGLQDKSGYTYISAENTPGSDNNQIKFFISNTTNDASNQVMIIDSNGKIGIGVTSPDEQLHIGGNLKVSGDLLGNIDYSQFNPKPIASTSSYGFFKLGSNVVINSEYLELDYTDNQLIDWTAENAGTIHTSNYTTYSKATTTTHGLVRGGYVSGVTHGTQGTAYGLTIDSNGVIYLDKSELNGTFERTATSSLRGGIKIGYTQSGKNYPVKLNSLKAYVDVPWTNTTLTSNQLIDWTAENAGTIHNGNYTNTTYSAATSSNPGGLIKIGYSTNNSNRNYAVELDSDNKAYVNVPWTNTTVDATGVIDWTVDQGSNPITTYRKIGYGNYTNTTYETATDTRLGLVKLSSTVTDGTVSYVQVDSNNRAYVNVPWTDAGNVSLTQKIDWTQSNAFDIHEDNYINYGNHSGFSSTGTVKTGYPEGGYKRAVQTDSKGNAFIDIPSSAKPTLRWQEYSSGGTTLNGSYTQVRAENYHVYILRSLGTWPSTKPRNFITLKNSVTNSIANSDYDMSPISLIIRHKDGAKTADSRIVALMGAPESRYHLDNTDLTNIDHDSTVLTFWNSVNETLYETMRISAGYIGKAPSGAYSSITPLPGCVGINDADPYVPLVVRNYNDTWTNVRTEGLSSYSGTGNNMKFSYISGTLMKGNRTLAQLDYDFMTSGDTRYVTAFFSRGIYGGSIQFVSDRRIKEDIEDVSSSYVLDIVRKIPCREYNYIDDNYARKGKTIGFISQEVNEIYPDAVNITSDFIPDKYEIINNEDLIWEEYTDSSDDTIKYLLTVNNYDLSNNTTVRFYVSNNFNYNNEPYSETRMEITSNDDGKFLFDTSYSSVFVFGKKVHDFHRLDKQKIFALHHPAIQELDKRQQAHDEKISLLKNKIAMLENQNSTIKAHLDDLRIRIPILEG